MKTPAPTHLLASSAQGVVEHHPVAQFELGTMQNLVYLVLDWKSDFGNRTAAIIDPQRDLVPIEAALEKYGFHLGSILLTHSHHDHVAGVPELLARYPHLKVHVHPRDRHRLKKVNESQITFVQDGEILSVGTLRLEALHTPGHSAGEISYLLNLTGEAPEYQDQSFLFTGDTLFIRDCGRTDLETGDDTELLKSLHRIRALPEETIILPGHHYAKECGSPLSIEKKTSPPLQCETVEEIKALP